MMAFVLTRKAREDLLSIGRYTEDKWGKNQRNRYLTMLDRAFLTLAENPSLGRSVMPSSRDTKLTRLENTFFFTVMKTPKPLKLYVFSMKGWMWKSIFK